MPVENVAQGSLQLNTKWSDFMTNYSELAMGVGLMSLISALPTDY